MNLHKEIDDLECRLAGPFGDLAVACRIAETLRETDAIGRAWAARDKAMARLTALKAQRDKPPAQRRKEQADLKAMFARRYGVGRGGRPYIQKVLP